MIDEPKQHLENPNASGEEQFAELTSQGEVIKEKMDKAGESLSNQLEGVSYVSAPLKSFERAKEKVEADYFDENGNPDYSQLTDVTRCSYVCNTYEQMVDLSKKLSKTLNVVKEKDTMLVPNEKTGFRNMSKSAKLAEDVSKQDLSPQKVKLLVGINGHISEIQLQLKCIYEVYGEEHKIYEERRSIEAKAKIENNRRLTTDEKHKIRELKQASIDIYDNVISEYNENTSGRKIQLHRDFFAKGSAPQISEKAQEMAKTLEPMQVGNMEDVLSMQQDAKAEAPKQAPKSEMNNPKPKGFE